MSLSNDISIRGTSGTRPFLIVTDPEGDIPTLTKRGRGTQQGPKAVRRGTTQGRGIRVLQGGQEKADPSSAGIRPHSG